MKVTFDGINKLIIVNNLVVELDVQVDLYSDWKEWMRVDGNAKYLPAFRSVGGDPTTGGKSVAPYFFLVNGWKIRPCEANHTLNIAGNLFVDEPETYGSNIIVPTIGNYQILVNLSVTSDAVVITQNVIQTIVEEIQYQVGEAQYQVAGVQETVEDIEPVLSDKHGEGSWEKVVVFKEE